VRTGGIAGELLTARGRPMNRSATWSGRRRVDGASRGQTGGCYKKSSWLRPLYKGWRLIYAESRAHEYREAPQAYINQTDQCCHQRATVKDLISTGSACSLLFMTWAAHMVFRGCVRKTSTLLPCKDARREVPGTRRLRAIAGVGIDLPARLLVCLFRAGDLRGLNSRQINHLQRIASETHYRVSKGLGKETRENTGMATRGRLRTHPGTAQSAGGGSGRATSHASNGR
jgi:hypothetical protein